LESIGAASRGFLRELEISVRRLQYVWQLPNGARTQLNKSMRHLLAAQAENARERVYPLNGHLIPDPNTDLEAVVKNVSPAIENVFSLLAGLKCALTMLLPAELVPGVR